MGGATVISVSLSVRRAWIEIWLSYCPFAASSASLSVRRAWIEIKMHDLTAAALFVALREESVD